MQPFNYTSPAGAYGKALGGYASALTAVMIVLALTFCSGKAVGQTDRIYVTTEKVVCSALQRAGTGNS